MLDACRAAVQGWLQPMNLKGVYFEETDGGAMKSKPCAILLWGDEELITSRRRLGQTDDLVAGTRTIHRQVARRTIPVLIRLVHERPVDLDRLVMQMLASIPRSVPHAELGRIQIALRGAETPPAEGVFRNRAEWEGVVEFTAPVVRNDVVRLFSPGIDVTLEFEIK